MNKKIKNYIYFFFIILLFGINFYFSNFVQKDTSEKQSSKQIIRIPKSSDFITKFKSESNKNNNDNLDISNEDLKLYISYLQKHIYSNWNPQNYGKNLNAIVNFTIDKNGNLIDYNIKRTSRTKDYDQKAIEALIKSAPFEKLPKNCEQDKIQLDFTFKYKFYP